MPAWDTLHRMAPIAVPLGAESTSSDGLLDVSHLGVRDLAAHSPLPPPLQVLSLNSVFPAPQAAGPRPPFPATQL